MNTGVFFAVLCLIFAGLNDFVFKKYSLKVSNSTGIYISLIGLFWFLFQTLFYFLNRSSIWTGVPLSAVIYSLLPGALLFLSNIMLIESMTVLDASLGSTLYRLNTVLTVILSVIFLDEKLRFLSFSGIAVSVLSVILLFERKADIKWRKHLIYLLIAVLASSFRALFAVSSKLLILSGIENKVIIAVSSITWFAGGALYSLIREKKILPDLRKIKYSFVSGFFIFIIVVFLFEAMKRSALNIVIPISNMGFLITYLLAIFYGIEKLTARKVSAMLLASAAIVILSYA